MSYRIFIEIVTPPPPYRPPTSSPASRHLPADYSMTPTGGSAPGDLPLHLAGSRPCESSPRARRHAALRRPVAPTPARRLGLAQIGSARAGARCALGMGQDSLPAPQLSGVEDNETGRSIRPATYPYPRSRTLAGCPLRPSRVGAESRHIPLCQ